MTPTEVGPNEITVPVVWRGWEFMEIGREVWGLAGIVQISAKGLTTTEVL